MVAVEDVYSDGYPASRSCPANRIWIGCGNGGARVCYGGGEVVMENKLLGLDLAREVRNRVRRSRADSEGPCILDTMPRWVQRMLQLQKQPQQPQQPVQVGHMDLGGSLLVAARDLHKAARLGSASEQMVSYCHYAGPVGYCSLVEVVPDRLSAEVGRPAAGRCLHMARIHSLYRKIQDVNHCGTAQLRYRQLHQLRQE